MPRLRVLCDWATGGIGLWYTNEPGEHRTLALFLGPLMVEWTARAPRAGRSIHPEQLRAVLRQLIVWRRPVGRIH